MTKKKVIRNFGTVSFRGRTRFPLFLMLPLCFNINCDGITVLKQSATTCSAIILAKILSSLLVQSSPLLRRVLFFFNDYTPLLVTEDSAYVGVYTGCGRKK